MILTAEPMLVQVAFFTSRAVRANEELTWVISLTKAWIVMEFHTCSVSKVRVVQDQMQAYCKYLFRGASLVWLSGPK